jgi:fibronectin-binding autotransporter adhesin
LTLIGTLRERALVKSALHILRNAKFLQGLLFLLGMGVGTSLFAAQTPLPGEIAYWRMDDAVGSPTATDSVGGNTGTLVNGPVFNATNGQVLGALNFDGVNDYVDCGNSPTLNLNGDMAISAWIYMTANNRDQKIVAKQDVGTGTGGYKMGVYTDNKFEFEIRDAANNAFLSRTVPGGTVLATNTWYHVVGVYSAGNYIRTYVNGVLDRELLLTNLCGATATNFVIGKEGGSNQYFWQGRLDEIHFVNRAISATEVAALYHGFSVNAGFDQAAILPGSANLAGTATWVIEPDPTWTFSPVWSRVSGPGTVTYAPNPPNNFNVTATYNTAGTHTMRLSVTRTGSATPNTDDMLVTSLKMWDGGDGASNNWTLNNNWTGTAPVALDPLIFGAAGAARKTTNTNNFAANTDFSTLFFIDNGYQLNGNAIDLTSGIQATNTTGTNTIALGLRLLADQTFNSSVAGTTLAISGNIDLNGFQLSLVGAGDFNLSGVISGSGVINKMGSGTLTLSGNNTYAGVTQLSAGTTIVTSNNGLGSNTVATVVDPGATLQVQGNITTAEPLSLSGTGNGGIGALRNNGNETLSGLVQLGANATVQNPSGTLTMSGGIVTNTFVATFDGASNTTESGIVSGTGGITKNGAGTLTLSGASTYSGATQVNAGTVIVTNNTGLGSAAGATTVVSGAMLQVNNNITSPENLTLAGTGVGAIGALNSSAGTNTMSGTVTLTANTEIGTTAGTLTLSGNFNNAGFTTTYDGAGNTVESGAVSGTGGIIKDAAGLLTLSGNSTYTGTTQLNTGITLLSSNNGLGSNAANTTVASGATLQVNNNITSPENLSLAGTGNGAIGALNNLSGANSMNGTVTLTANTTILSTAGTLTLAGAFTNAGFTAIYDGAANIVESGIVSGTGGIIKNGAGTLTLSGNSTYGGASQLNTGITILTNNNGLGAIGTGTTVASGATLQVQNTITSAEPLSLAGTGSGGIGALNNGANNNTMSGAIVQSADATITSTAGTLTLSGGLNNAGFVSTFDGAGTTNDSSVITGAGDVIKNGSGTLQLSGAASNTYGGTTFVNAGIVDLNKTPGLNALPGPVIIGNNDGTASNDVVRLLANNQIPVTSAITVTSSGLLNLNNFNDGIGGLLINSGTTSGGNVTTGTGTLTLGGDVSLTVFGTGASGATIAGNLALGGVTRSFDIANGTSASDLTVSAIISDGGGASGVTKIGAGTLVLSGANSNTYTGTTTVNVGQIDLNKTAGQNAIPAALVIGDNDGTASNDVVRLLAADQIPSTSAVTVTSSGLLSLNGNTETLGGITLNSGVTSGANVTTGAGTLTLAGDVTLTAFGTGATGATMTGNLNLGGVTRTFNVADGQAIADLTVSSIVSNGNVTKTGAGTLVFSGGNNYAGATLVSAGILNVQNALGLGTNAAGTTVSTGATLQLQGGITVATEALTLNGTGTTALPATPATAPDPGALENVSGNNIWNGTVALNTASSIGVDLAANTLTLGGVISGGNNLTKVGDGILRFSGGGANTYTGTTFINDGVLELNKTAGTNAVAAAIEVGTNDSTALETLRLIASDQIPAVTVTVHSDGIFNLNNQSDAIGALTLESGTITGAQVASGTGTLTLGGNVSLNVFGTGATEASISGFLSLGAANRVFDVSENVLALPANQPNTDLLVSAVISGARTLTKTGNGTLELSAVNLYSGNTTVSAGTLLVNGSTATSPTTTVSGGTLGGSGTVGIISATGGKVSPGGANAGQAGSIGNLASRAPTFNNATTFEIESTGSAAGSFDTLQVTTANADLVTLGNAVLSVLAAPGTYTADMVIINNAGGDAVVGTFGGLASGATVNGGGQFFQILYTGGTGNDVVLRPIPTVNNVTSSTANGIYGIGATVSIQVTFSQNITVTGTPRLTLETGTTDAVVNFVNVTGGNTMNFTYTVAAGHASLDLDYLSTAALALNGGTITGTGPGALAANLTLPAPGTTGSLGFNKNIEIDTSAPLVINVTSPNADGIYTIGGVIDVQVQFDDIVNVTGTPRIQLETGTADVQANYVSGTGTDTLTFRFTVAAGHYTPDLNYLATNSLTLNGGTINDGVNNAVLTLPALAGVGSLATNKNIIISTPVITARQTQDTDGNGFIDAIRITTDQPLFDNFTGLNVTVAGYALAGGSYDTGGTANDNEFFVRLTEGPAPDTDKTPSVTVVAGGNLLIPTDAGVTPVDAARPVLMTSLWTDASGGGVTATDSILLTFSEPVLSNNCFAVALLGTPVTGDNIDASSTIPATVVASYSITVTLNGNPILTPGGTYSNALTVPGSPTGLYVIPVVGSPDPLGNANVFDPVGNLSHVQTFGTAIDLGPTAVNVAIAWDDLSITSKLWNIGISDVGQVHTAFAAFPPTGLVARNVGNVRSKFTVSCTGSAPTGWALASAAGADAFEMKVDASTPLDAFFELDLGTGPKDIVNQLYSGHNKPFDLRFATPLSITSGAGVSQDITVTITITQD